MGDVHKLQLVEVGENFVFPPDEILKQAKGQGFANVVVIGECDCGALCVSGAKNAGEAMILLHRAMAQICGIGGEHDGRL